MVAKTKIVIAGIGGVGGYFGGLLAKKYAESEFVEIYFLVRGENLKQIRKNGIKVISKSETFVAKPKLASDNPADFGVADCVFICTKTFDLESISLQLKPCIGNETYLLPLLNGVDADEKLQILFPDQIVLQGCVYIVSQLKEAGVIENSGNIQTLFFGKEDELNERLFFLEKLCKDAGIEATASEKISSIIWEKFIFISATATATSFFNNCIGAVLENHPDFLEALIIEVKNLALAKMIHLDDQIVQKTIQKLRSLPYEATSSMHRDKINGKLKNELEALTGYVVKKGKELAVPTPAFESAYLYLNSTAK